MTLSPAQKSSSITIIATYIVLFFGACHKDKSDSSSKPITISPATERFIRTWNWKEGQYIAYSLGTGTTVVDQHALNDTSFAITLINDTALMAWGQAMPYIRSTNSFCDHMSFWSPEVWFINDTLHFTYRNNQGNGMRFETTYKAW